MMSGRGLEVFAIEGWFGARRFAALNVSGSVMSFQEVAR